MPRTTPRPARNWKPRAARSRCPACVLKKMARFPGCMNPRQSLPGWKSASPKRQPSCRGRFHIGKPAPRVPTHCRHPRGPALKRFPSRRLLQQQRRRRETFAVLLRQVLSTGDEVGQAVLVDELQGTTAPGRKTDAEHRTDVGVGGGAQYALLHTTHGLYGLDEQQTIAHILG